MQQALDDTDADTRLYAVWLLRQFDDVPWSQRYAIRVVWATWGIDTRSGKGSGSDACYIKHIARGI